MPLDNKRINGPEKTISYEVFAKSRQKSFHEFYKEVINPEGLRSDGRKANDHRKIFLKSGIVSQAKGSAYIEVNNTKVIVSVFDPREIPNKTDYGVNGELYCEFKYATFSCPNRRSHQQDAEEKQNSMTLKQALEPAVCRHEFPNFQVDIYALVLENDGSAVSAAITCAGTALANAGIPMFDLITSTTLGVQGNILFLDPTLNEENLCNIAVKTATEGGHYDNHGIIIMSMLHTNEQVSGFQQTGNINSESMDKAIKLLVEASKSIVPLVKKCLVKHVLKNTDNSVVK